MIDTNETGTELVNIEEKRDPSDPEGSGKGPIKATISGTGDAEFMNKKQDSRDSRYAELEKDAEKEADSFLCSVVCPIAFYVGWWAYLIAALVMNFDKSYKWLIVTLVATAYYAISFCFRNVEAMGKCWSRCTSAIGGCMSTSIHNTMTVGTLIILQLSVAVLIWVIVDCAEDPVRFQSFAGLIVLVSGCYGFAHFKGRKVRWKPVFGGLFMQWVMALFILRTPSGFDFFNWLGEQVEKFLQYSKAGSGFLFNLESQFQVQMLFGGAPVFGAEGAQINAAMRLTEVLAFNILPTVVFFSSVVSLLFYLGWLQFLINKLAWIMKFSLGTKLGESVNAAGNIFVGMTEAPLLIAPFLATMSLSEIHAVMTGGFATIAGSVMAIYIGIGVPSNHLIAASVMSAPAALALSKLVYPEEIKTDEDGNEIDEDEEIPEVKSEALNVFGAVAQGASISISLVANIAAMIIAFLGILAFLNASLGYFGSLVDYPELSFEKICSWVFFPLAWLLGVPPKDCGHMGEMLGIKTFANEFLAYDMLVQKKKAGLIDDRTNMIATYALCGFANFGSIGIILGGLTPLAPKRGNEFSRIVFSAMVCGTIACFMTACVAGIVSQ